LEQWSV